MRRRSALLASLAGLLATRPARAEAPDPAAPRPAAPASATSDPAPAPPAPPGPGPGPGPGRPPAPADPRDIFGLGGARPPAASPSTCDDGRTFGCAVALDPLDPASPAALRTRLTGRYLLRLPVGDARHDTAAGFALGASRDDAGLVFGGATGLETTWTIEGAPAESLRTGAVETRVPLAFVEELVVTAGGSSARDRASTGGSVDAVLLRGGDRRIIDARAWGTLYAAADRTRPLARSSYQLRRIAFRPRGEVTASLVDTGPLPRLRGGRAWYAAGLAPNLGTTDVRWRTGTLVDANGDGAPDGFPGIVETSRLADRAERAGDYFVPAMARAGWSRGPHDVALTLVGHATGDSVFFANATQRAAGVDRRTWVGDAIASWRGRWRDTRAELRLSWHRSVRREAARDPAAAGIPQLQTAYVPTTLAEEPDLAAACDDTAVGDRLPTLPNCPIPFGFFLSGGAGLLTDAVGDRPAATAGVAHRLGRHVLRAGGTVEDSRVVQTARFTGGDIQRSIVPGIVDRQRFYTGTCGADALTPCNYTDESELAYRTRYAAAYLEDTVELAPNLRVDAGLRWELMWVGPYLHLSRQLAPRFGVAWDVLGGGTSRLFATLGRSFVMLNPGLGPTVIARPTSVRDLGGVLGDTRRVDDGGVFPVADGIRPAAQDEATAGLEIGRIRTARAAVWVQARTLRRGYETVIDDPEAFTLRFDNPGRDGGTPASRASTTLAIEVSTDPDARTVARAAYLYGRTTGTWVGPADPRQGAQLYTSSDWDGDTSNYDGRLPTDAGHRAFVEGERRGRLGAVDVGVALRLSVASGRPRNVLADTDGGIVYLVPRGSAGRAPLVSQANVRVAARWRGTDLTLDVFNVFDRETATHFDEVYAGGTVRPIRGGREEDLVFLKDDTGAPAVRRSAFRLPSAFQSPIAATLGIHRAF